MAQNASPWSTIILLLGLAGALLTFTGNSAPQPVVPAEDPRCGGDLRLYRSVVAEVASGVDYYTVADRELRRWGFPVGCLFNWRLPTYALCLARLPGEAWIQPALWLLFATGVGLLLRSELQTLGLAGGLIFALGCLGIVKWSWDGEAYYAQEIWLAGWILLSLACRRQGWHRLAAVAGLIGLFWRELALPFAFIGWLQSARLRRWQELAIWTVGMMAWGLFLAWHAGQVRQHLSAADLAASNGIWGWVEGGGVSFVVLANRMNGSLYALPGWLVWSLLWLGLVGLTKWQDEQGETQAVTLAAYLAAFAIVGQPMNMYWGLAFAPLLPSGWCRAVPAMQELWRSAAWPRGLFRPVTA